jgi:predicted SAM-dependent methyltransferase
VDALEYFDQTDEKYDVIYLSHVFEHFSIEEGIRLARQISHHLTPQGVWINFMPNA